MDRQLMVAFAVASVVMLLIVLQSKLNETRFLKVAVVARKREFDLNDDKWMEQLGMVSYEDDGSSEKDFVDKLPGQQEVVDFGQYSGYVNVDEAHGREVFYYFVEASHPRPDTKPLVLWLTDVPGCSALGNGAMTEHGPFGVQADGKTLFLRQHAWNKVANMIYLESPAGVGFSYSNTTSDYKGVGDLRTALDSYTFLVKWMKRFPKYQKNEFFIMGEYYAGFYVPELADVIIYYNIHAEININLKGIMVGNGYLNAETDQRGVFDYLWNHALISEQTYRGLVETCVGPYGKDCLYYKKKTEQEMGSLNLYNRYSEDSSRSENHHIFRYLNLLEVKQALHVKKARLPSVWRLCSSLFNVWGESPPSLFPVYRRLISARLRIFLYSGDWDAVVPVTSTLYSIKAMNLTLKSQWHPWLDDTEKIAGHRVDYEEGVTFATVLGARHEVPKFQPRKAFSLVKMFLEGL